MQLGELLVMGSLYQLFGGLKERQMFSGFSSAIHTERPAAQLNVNRPTGSASCV
jgi:hypothetical protein